MIDELYENEIQVLEEIKSTLLLVKNVLKDFRN